MKKYTCLTCAVLNDGTDKYAVKLKHEDGTVVDGTSNKELVPNEQYSGHDFKETKVTVETQPEPVEEEETTKTTKKKK